jgi:hypothetical protein
MSRKNSPAAKAARREAKPSRPEARPPEWTTFRRMEPAEVVREVEPAIAELGLPPVQAAEARRQAREVETWSNSRYRVRVYRKDGAVRGLQVQVGAPGVEAPGWSELQRVKNEIAGPEAEAYEIFPAESRLVDGGPAYWLFVAPPGEKVPGGLYERITGLPARGPIIDGYIPDGYREAPRRVRADYE